VKTSRNAVAELYTAAEVALAAHLGDHPDDMPKPNDGRQLISLAQKLARDAERHALLSASLASQADRLMIAGLKILQAPPPGVAHAAPTAVRPPVK
jgi:hypothetical protein